MKKAITFCAILSLLVILPSWSNRPETKEDKAKVLAQQVWDRMSHHRGTGGYEFVKIEVDSAFHPFDDLDFIDEMIEYSNLFWDLTNAKTDSEKSEIYDKIDSKTLDIDKIFRQFKPTFIGYRVIYTYSAYSGEDKSERGNYTVDFYANKDMTEAITGDMDGPLFFRDTAYKCFLFEATGGTPDGFSKMRSRYGKWADIIYPWHDEDNTK